MTTFVRCGCEALYEQTETKTTRWVEDSAECKICGYQLRAWSGNRVLSFELVENPTV